MPPHRKSLVGIDDDDVMANENNSLGHAGIRKTNPIRREQNSRSALNDDSSISSHSRRASHLNTTPQEDLVKFSLENQTIPHMQCTFRSPNWTFSTKQAKNASAPSARSASNEFRLLPQKKGSSAFAPPFTLSPSPSSCLFKSGTGTAGEPIELDGGEDISDSHERRESFLKLHDTIDLSDDSMDLLDDQPDPTSALSRSKSRHPAPDDEIIDLEDLEYVETEAEETNRGVKICIEDVYQEDPKPLKRTSRAPKFARRNPKVVAPDVVCESFQYKSMRLRANKTVQLLDGNLIRLKAVIVNTKTQEAKIRGHRLQRTRDLNGILERKMNEVVLLLEIDLDDPRDPLDQDVVEVAVNDIVKIRSLRTTNQKFPDCRNIQLRNYKNVEDVTENGGLTLRWKFTSTYASAADRNHNIFKERRLERLRAEECNNSYTVEDELRRFQWRGETIRGGSFPRVLSINETDPLPESRQESTILIEDSSELEESMLIDREISVFDRQSVWCSSTFAQEPNTTKRKHSRLDSGPQDKGPFNNQVPKKLRGEKDRDIEGAVEKTRRRLSNINLQSRNGPQNRRTTIFMDLTSDDLVFGRPSGPSQSMGSSGSTPRKTLRQHQDIVPSNSSDLAPSPQQTIDLYFSELSTPPPSGSIESSTPQPIKPITRSAGQALTYGDAFCGAGGATRGAVMAGLKVLWGFDFSEHACQSWRANFPNAQCYDREAHSFVSIALKAAARGNPHLMKVDILHLSPPCQFFSPAHTIDGKDDEMNVASLFAVQSVIAVSKARVVTLEQTFGIVCPRFRFYFNALIQMFTANDFSARWAVVPLAQWGVPQRRNRLIIIASCPGEILPRMPAATHSDPAFPLPNTRPFVSANSTLRSIPHDAPDHNPHDPSLQFPPHRQQLPWDGSKILPRAMTTSGGQNYHPSGKRDLTLSEYAAMQGFPQVHVFRGNYKKKQIGNAVPPVVAKILFESVKRDLDRADGIIEEVEVID